MKLLPVWVQGACVALNVLGCSNFNRPVRIGLAVGHGTTLRFFAIDRTGGLSENTGSPTTGISNTLPPFFSPGSDWLVSFDFNNAKVFPLTARTLTLGNPVTTAVFQATCGCITLDGGYFFQGEILAAGTTYYRIGSTGGLTTVSTSPGINVAGCITDPNSKGIWVSDQDNSSLRLFPVPTASGAVSTVQNTAISLGGYLTINSSGDTLVASDAGNSSLKAISVNGTTTSVTGTTSLPGITGLTRAGSFYIASSGTSVKIYSLSGGTLTLASTLTAGSTVRSISADSFGTYLAVGDSSSAKLYSISSTGALNHTATISTGANTYVALEDLLVR